MSRGTDTGATAGKRPLEGVRVLDFTRVLSGPHATRMLSDLGAEVIKVEPPEGDLTRFAQPRVNSLSSYFIQQNIGKKNISLDLSKPEAADLIIHAMEAAIQSKRVPHDFARLMDGASQVSCSGFGQVLIDAMS